MTPRFNAIFAGAALLGTVAAFAIPDARGLEGTARVVDGDTLDVNGQRVRLWGIDAFESSQTCQSPHGNYSCGRAATQTMEELVRNQHVRCVEKDSKRSYGRIVAQCFVGTTDLGKALVMRGWAFDYTHYSGGFYKDEQTGARDVGRGAWAGSFQWPWDYRHGKK